MCGIYFCYHLGFKQQLNNEQVQSLKARGPTSFKEIKTADYYCAFYRLAVFGSRSSPYETEQSILMCNGEIYNTDFDTELIQMWHEQSGIDTCVHLLDGEFAFVLYDKKESMIYFARDRYGRKPLYYTRQADNFRISSTYHGLGLNQAVDTAEYSYERNTEYSYERNTEYSYERNTEYSYERNTEYGCQVIPGYLYTFDIKAEYLTAQPFRPLPCKEIIISNQLIHDQLVQSIQKRIRHANCEVGFMLSGGLDSSIILSIALKYQMVYKPQVFTFGFDESASDVQTANKFVNWLYEMYGQDCIQWHKVIQPVSDGLQAIPEVIQAIESYDTTTVRASVPMFLLSKYISRNTNVKVIISGEGSDELFGGYLYFRYAPNKHAYKAEIHKLLNQLYLYDVLRADRTTAAHGLEIRPPFLDDQLVNMVLLSKDLKPDISTTKPLLREISKDYLPDFIAQGKKEAFSDAVSHSWIESIPDFARRNITRFGPTSNYIKPFNFETMYYQTIFNDHFGTAWFLTPQLWLPSWVETHGEPSARVLPVYDEKN